VCFSPAAAVHFPYHSFDRQFSHFPFAKNQMRLTLKNGGAADW